VSAKTITERAKQLIDNLATDEVKVILNLLERFNEEKGIGGR